MNILLKKVMITIAMATAILGSNNLAYAKEDKKEVIMEVTTTEKNSEVTTEENVSDDTTEVISSDDKKYKVRISIFLEKTGWYNDKAIVKFDAVKIYGDSNFKIDTVEARIGANGSWIDVTDDMCLEISENCTIYVKVTDMNGNEYEKNRFIRCFDFVEPTLNAAVSEGLLTVLTYDTESGVKNLYINEYSFIPDENGIVSVRLQRFDSTYQYFYIYAIDNAGNASRVYTVNNPYYKPEPTGDEDEDDPDPADSLPDNAKPGVTNPSTGSVTSVTDESGKDITEEISMKQFYTIVTKDGQQYFLVIDMSPAYTDDDGVDVTRGNGTVYFLTSVSNENLLNFVDSNEQTLPHNSVAQGNNLDTETVSPNMDESVTEKELDEETEEVKEDKKDGATNIILYAVIGVIVAVIVFVKVSSAKKGKPSANDDTMYGAKEDADDEDDSYEEEIDM